MRFQRSLPFFLGMFIVSQARAADIVSMLPTGVVRADVMALAAPPRLQELALRFKSAMSADPEWFRVYVSKSPRGAALPYNAKFGISETEYEELLELSEKQILAKQGEAEILFKTLPDGSIEIEAPELADLNGIVIDPKKNRASTSFGVLDVRTAIDNQDSASPTGPWTGIQWSAESLDASMANGFIAKLALGRLKADGRLILYLTGKRVEDSKLTRRLDLILFFSARAGSA